MPVPFQVKRACNRPTEKGHDEVLGGESGKDGAGDGQGLFKVIHAQGHAHAEHDDAEPPDNHVLVEPGESGRETESQTATNQRPERKQVCEAIKPKRHGSNQAFRGVCLNLRTRP